MSADADANRVWNLARRDRSALHRGGGHAAQRTENMPAHTQIVIPVKYLFIGLGLRLLVDFLVLFFQTAMFMNCPSTAHGFDAFGIEAEKF